VIEGYLFEAEVFLRSDWNAPLFTGKLVKSMIIDALPELKVLFNKSSGVQPKLIHVSPLFQFNGGGIRCIYSGTSGYLGKRKPAPKITINGKYRFYIGFVEDGSVGFDAVYNALMGISGRHQFSNRTFEAELLSLRTVDVEREASRALEGMQVSGGGKVRLVFSSPTMLRDPFRTDNHKSLVPSPLNIFSTPIYIYLYLSGKLTQRRLYKLAIIIHRVINEAHTIHDTVKKVWVYYEPRKNPVPALIGYANLYLNTSYYEKYMLRYDLPELLKEVFKLSMILGIGTSRAAGFGHVAFQPTGKT